MNEISTLKPSSAEVAGVILAAGGSTRMGRPKQLLHFEGESLIRRAVRMALEGGVRPVVVVLGAEAERIAEELEGLPARHVINADWQRGIGSSIRAGVGALRASGPEPAAVAIMLCDQPLLNANVIAQIVARYHEALAPIVACRYEGAVGVPALFDRSYFGRLESLRDDVGAKSLIAEAEGVQAISLPSAAFDLDTPEDYERLQREMQLARR